MGKWELNFREYFKEKSNRIFAYRIFSDFLFSQIRGKAEKRKKLDNRDYYINNFFDLIDFLYEDLIKMKNYSTTIFPTLISIKEAENFYFINEKQPEREEIFYYLYLLSTSIYTYRGNRYLINLISDNKKGWESFISEIKKEEAGIFIINKESSPISIDGLNTSKINSYLNSKIPFSLKSRNVFIFALINFFVVWWLKERRKIIITSLEDLDKKLKDENIDDSATLVLFDFSGNEKKKIYFYPRLNKFIEKWYFDYLKSQDDKDIFLPKFLANFIIYDKKYQNLSTNYLDKFLYYLLKDQVNGELLDKLINLHINYNFKEKKFLPIREANKFYAAITRRI
ncbi:MAG: hypothetical protein NC935_06770 [Candidatus Omnitrophica bacterium]|nr:hypothetical protein [Candidatus Omnitrophota bacterium]